MSDIWAQQVLPDILELFTDKYCELVVRSDDPSKHVSLIFPCLYAIFKLDDDNTRSQSHIDIIMKWLHIHKQLSLERAGEMIRIDKAKYIVRTFQICAYTRKYAEYINNIRTEFSDLFVLYRQYERDVHWFAINISDVTKHFDERAGLDAVINIIGWIYSIPHELVDITCIDGKEKCTDITIR